jgi:hypothetical protein
MDKMTDRRRAEKVYLDWCNGKHGNLIDVIEKLIKEIRQGAETKA